MGNQYWQWLLEVQIFSGKDLVKFRADSSRGNRFEITVNIPFSDEPTPSQAEVTIYNLSSKSINLFKKGNKVVINAGYSSLDTGKIFEGTITSLQPSLLSGVDRITSFTALEGTDYSEQEVNITFGNGTDANTMIRRIASTAKIPLGEIQLRTNKVYGSGYTADGQAVSILAEIAEACNTSLYYRRGQLIIKNFRDGNTQRLKLSASTGLINQPSKVENNDYSGWSVESLFQHRISTGTAVSIDSKNVKGNFYVKNGYHSYDGSSFVTNCEVVT